MASVAKAVSGGQHRPNDGKRFIHKTFKAFITALRQEKLAKKSSGASAKVVEQFYVHSTIAAAINHRKKLSGWRELRIYAYEMERTQARFFFCMKENEYNEMFGKMITAQQCFHEVLAEVSGFNVFLDVDAECDKDSQQRADLERLLEMFIEWISGELPARYGPLGAEREISYCILEFDASDEKYLSRHVIIHNYAFKSIDKMKVFVVGLKRAFALKFRGRCVQANLPIDSFVDAIDEVPYRSGGQFRLPRNRNGGGERPLILSRIYVVEGAGAHREAELTEELQEMSLQKGYVVLLEGGAKEAFFCDASMRILLKDIGVDDEILGQIVLEGENKLTDVINAVVEKSEGVSVEDGAAANSTLKQPAKSSASIQDECSTSAIPVAPKKASAARCHETDSESSVEGLKTASKQKLKAQLQQLARRHGRAKSKQTGANQFLDAQAKERIENRDGTISVLAFSSVPSDEGSEVGDSYDDEFINDEPEESQRSSQEFATCSKAPKRKRSLPSAPSSSSRKRPKVSPRQYHRVNPISSSDTSPTAASISAISHYNDSPAKNDERENKLKPCEHLLQADCTIESSNTDAKQPQFPVEENTDAVVATRTEIKLNVDENSKMHVEDVKTEDCEIIDEHLDVQNQFGGSNAVKKDSNVEDDHRGIDVVITTSDEELLQAAEYFEQHAEDFAKPRDGDVQKNENLKRVKFADELPGNTQGAHNTAASYSSKPSVTLVQSKEIRKSFVAYPPKPTNLGDQKFNLVPRTVVYPKLPKSSATSFGAEKELPIGDKTSSVTECDNTSVSMLRKGDKPLILTSHSMSLSLSQVQSTMQTDVLAHDGNKAGDLGQTESDEIVAKSISQANKPALAILAVKPSTSLAEIASVSSATTLYESKNRAQFSAGIKSVGAVRQKEIKNEAAYDADTEFSSQE